jgi:hypothetical protein
VKTAHWFGLLGLSIALTVAGCTAGTTDDKKDSAKGEQSAAGQLVTVAVPGMT